jgi:hypothetical protein
VPKEYDAKLRVVRRKSKPGQRFKQLFKKIFAYQSLAVIKRKITNSFFSLSAAPEG